MAKYNVGIIGYGWAATAHIDAINACPDAQVVAIYSSRPLDADELKRRYGSDITPYRDVKKLIADEADAYLGSKTARLTVEGTDVLVVPQAYTVLALVLHEMITNSVKYGSLCDQSGKLLIRSEQAEDGSLELHWREEGGPPVKPPSRRGFGSTIIEKSIPHELQGEADVEFALGGLQARFLIPGRFLQDAETEHEMTTHVEHGGDGTTGPTGDLPQRVLLIEDNMIIALDTEEMLKELGVAEITVSGSVTQALRF